MVQKFPAPALSQGIRILRLLEADGSLSLEKIAGSTEIPKSTTLRILVTLEGLGLVSRNKESLRYRALQKLTPLEDANERLITQAETMMRAMADQTQETVELHAYTGGELEMIHRVTPSEAEVRVVARIGHKRDLRELDSLSILVQAFGSEAPAEGENNPSHWRWEQGIKTSVPPQEQKNLVGKARENRKAQDFQMNNNGVKRFSAPICDPRGLLTAIVSLAQGFKPRPKSTDPELLDLVAGGAQILENQLKN